MRSRPRHRPLGPGIGIEHDVSDLTAAGGPGRYAARNATTLKGIPGPPSGVVDDNFMLAEAKTEHGSFAEAADQLSGALEMSHGLSSADRLLVEEVKLWCTHGMLLHLDRPHRIAYILGEILELASEEGADILEITPDAFRKRLSRARGKLDEFLRGHCGLVERQCACRCAKLVGPAVELGVVDPERLRYVAGRQAESLRRDIDEFANAAELFRSHPTYKLALRELAGHKFGTGAA